MLGEGSFCTVYRAIDKETNAQIAVKVIKRKNLHKDGVSLLRKEAELLQTIDHANIVKFKHVSTSSSFFCVVILLFFEVQRNQREDFPGNGVDARRATFRSD